MAELLVEIGDLVAPDSRVVVWAHNVHIQRHRPVSCWLGVCLTVPPHAGFYLAESLDDDWVPIALAARKTWALHTANEARVFDDDRPNSVEADFELGFFDVAKSDSFGRRQFIGGNSKVAMADDFRGLALVDISRPLVPAAKLFWALQKDDGQFWFSIPGDLDSVVVQRLISAYRRWLRLEGWEQSPEGLWKRDSRLLQLSTSHIDEVTTVRLERLAE
jgi:hypothetical protein